MTPKQLDALSRVLFALGGTKRGMTIAEIRAKVPAAAAFKSDHALTYRLLGASPYVTHSASGWRFDYKAILKTGNGAARPVCYAAVSNAERMAKTVLERLDWCPLDEMDLDTLAGDVADPDHSAADAAEVFCSMVLSNADLKKFRPHIDKVLSAYGPKDNGIHCVKRGDKMVCGHYATECTEAAINKMTFAVILLLHPQHVCKDCVGYLMA